MNEFMLLIKNEGDPIAKLSMEQISHVPVLFLWGMYDRAFKVDFLDRFKKIFFNHRIKMLKARHFWQEDRPEEASMEIMQWYWDINK